MASIQKRTSPVKFAHLAEKSENGSVSNLSTKVDAGISGELTALQGEVMVTAEEVQLRRRMNIELNFHPNFERLVLGCLDAEFCK